MTDDASFDSRLSRLEDAGIAGRLADQRLIAADVHAWSPDQVKEYLEALLTEKDRALRMADDERGKAAENLRIEVERARREGDDRLREHIENQIRQIRGDLASADKLEQARVDAVADRLEELNRAGHASIEARIAGVQREVGLVHQAQETAISKAEASTEKRFESINEFRAEARAVREAQQAETASLARSFLPREVADAKFVEHARLIDALEKRLDTSAGRSAGITASVGLMIAAAGILISLVVVFANLLTG
jgi:hypothetical protein